MEIVNVKEHSKPLPVNQVSGLPLFDWRQVVVTAPASRAGRYVMRRYRLQPHVAETVAQLAGFAGSEER